MWIFQKGGLFQKCIFLEYFKSKYEHFWKLFFCRNHRFLSLGPKLGFFPIRVIPRSSDRPYDYLPLVIKKSPGWFFQLLTSYCYVYTDCSVFALTLDWADRNSYERGNFNYDCFVHARQWMQTTVCVMNKYFNITWRFKILIELRLDVKTKEIAKRYLSHH